FIAAAEVLGALGLVLPGLLRMARWLTPLAAVGLMTIMIGATVMTLATPQPALAVVPFLAGLLAAFVGYNRQKEVAQ
ncbi:MAG TPA: DoxX family protein, partial [Thermoanaerobaculia bacterium]|nr:DoxX family protein [Thermoanaerobaculia bacterium]